MEDSKNGTPGGCSRMRLLTGGVGRGTKGGGDQTLHLYGLCKRKLPSLRVDSSKKELLMSQCAR